jgi:aconitate hydratase
MPDEINGEVTIKVGELITTDHIMPAGPRLKYRSNIEKYASFVFEPIDPKFPERARTNKANNVHNVIVAGESYGQGSSREHAAMCPMFLGVKAVIAKSIERIHAANLVNFGILPLTFEDNSDYDAVAQGAKILIPDARRIIAEGKDLQAEVDGKRIKLKYSLSQRQKDILLEGGLLPYTAKEQSNQDLE